MTTVEIKEIKRGDVFIFMDKQYTAETNFADGAVNVTGNGIMRVAARETTKVVLVKSL